MIFLLSLTVITEAPTNIIAFSPSPEILEISWNAIIITNATFVVDAYIIFYREKLLSGQPYQRFSTVNTTARLTWLKPGTEYVYRVLAYTTSKGNGLASPLETIRTAEKRKFIFGYEITYLVFFDSANARYTLYQPK